MNKNIFNEKFNFFIKSNKKKLITLAILTLISISICALWLLLRYVILFPGPSIISLYQWNELKNNREKILKPRYGNRYLIDNLVVAKNYLFVDFDKAVNNKDKKVLVYFPGNGDSSLSLLSSFNNNQSVINAGNDHLAIMCVRYPSYAFSEKKVIQHGYDAIKHLIELGYSPENIDIVSHSIGGGVSSQVLRQLAKDKVKINNYVNINSFSKIRGVINVILLGSPESLQKSVFRKRVISFLSSVLFCGFKLDAEKAINDQENFAAKKTTVIMTKDDKVIGEYSSLYRKIHNKEIKKIKNEVEVLNQDKKFSIEVKDNNQNKFHIMDIYKRGLNEMEILEISNMNNMHNVVSNSQIREILSENINSLI